MAKNTLNTPLLAGYFGHGNAGDEMILRMLQRRLGPAPFLSGPRPVGDTAVPRFHLLKLFQSLRRSRALLLGGGELFQSRTSLRSLVYYLTLPLLARMLGRPVLGFSLALDPDLGPLGRRLTAFALRKAVALWVRDETSCRFLEKGRDHPPTMPDVVWAWPVPKIQPPASLQRVLWIPRFPTLEESGLSLRAAFRSFPETAPPHPALRATFPQEGKENRDFPSPLGRGQGEGFEQLPFPANITHGILALDPFEDGPSLARFRNRVEVFHRLETWTTPDDIFEIMSRYDLVVTMRYHGLVAAVLAGRPVVAIPGHGKVLELARELNVPIVEPISVSSTDWPNVFRRTFEAGPPSRGDRPARAAAALDDLAAILLHN